MTALSHLFQDESSTSLPAAVEQAMEEHLHHDDELACWRAFEQSSAGQEYPEWVSRIFINILNECEQSGALPPALLEYAFEHCNEWFSSDPEEQAYVLIELARLAPEHSAIFDQCTVTLTHAQRWESLLALHDRRAEVVGPDARRSVLEQAAQIAQDFGQDADRALGYYASLLELDPTNDRVFSIFVRLVTRQEAWPLYAETLAKRAPHLPEQQAQAALLGRAALLSEKIKDQGAALRQYAAVLEQDPQCESALQSIVQVSQDREQPLEIQCQALELLFSHYQSQDKSEHALAVVFQHIERIAPRQDLALEHTRLSLLNTLGQTPELCQYAATLLLSHPDNEQAQAFARDLVHEHEQVFSVSMLEALNREPRELNLASIDLVMRCASHLSPQEEHTPAVAQALLGLIGNSQIDSGARQDAARLYQTLSDEDRARFENPDSLEAQIALCGDESQRVGLLMRLANRVDDSDPQHLDAWQRLLTLRPDHVQAQDQIASFLQGREDWETLASHLEHCVQYCDNSERALKLELFFVDVELDERERIDSGIARMRTMLERYPDAEQVATRYHETLLLHDRHQEFVDWLRPRAFARRDVDAMVECGEVYAQQLSEYHASAKCVLQALEVRPDCQAARTLGLSLLEQGLEFDTTSLAGALWRSFLAIDIDEEQLDAFVTISDAYREQPNQAALWIEAEARFERGQDSSGPRFRCLTEALRRNPRNASLSNAFLALIEDDASHAGPGYQAVIATIESQSPQPQDAAPLYDLAAKLAQASQDESVKPAHAVAAQLSAWRSQPNEARHLGALHGAIDAEQWDAVVELTAGASKHGNWIDPGHLWAKVCQQTHPAPESIPLPLIRKFAEYVAQDPGRFDKGRSEWLWQLAALLAHHQEFLEARQLALPLVYLQELPVDDARLRTLYAWLRMEPIRSNEALDVADRLVDRINLNVEERRAHASLDRELRSPGRLDLQLAAWESCERALLNQQDWDKPPALVIEAMYEALEAYLDIAVHKEQQDSAFGLAARALKLPFPLAVHERFFSLCWKGLGYPTKNDEQALIDPDSEPMLTLLEIDRTRRLALNVGYQDESSVWKAELLSALLGSKKRYTEQMEVLVERLERAEAQGPPNTPKQLMELRLAISQTLRSLSRDDGHLDYLLTNLQVIAAHPQSLERASLLLHERGDHERLAQLWCDQAQSLVEHHDGDRQRVNPRAADLWCKAAECYESQLNDAERAAWALEQARKLVAKPEILESLVKIYLSEPCLDKSKAAAHLHRRLDLASEQERLALSYQLAELYLEIKQPRQSQSVIDEVFDHAAKIVEFRRLYLSAVDCLNDPPQMLEARVRLAGFFTADELDKATKTTTRLLSQLDAHEFDIRALLPLLETSAPQYPSDLVLQKHFVTALAASGRRDDAADHLLTLISAQGRRRSPQRASLHALLGDQYALSKKLVEAASQYQQAALMDSAHARRWIDVARLYATLEDIPAAERALRTLLVHAQKLQSSDIRTPSAAWVMLQLYLLNHKAGNQEVAQSHWESCRDRCTQDVQAAREVLCELAKDPELHGQYMELADRLLDEELSLDFKAEILAQRAEHLQEANDEDAAFEMILAAISHDPTPAVYSSFALKLAQSPEKEKSLDEHLDQILSRSDAQEETQNDSSVLRSQKVMALCTKARLCARYPDRHGEIEGYLDQASAQDSRPIELLRTRHDVAYQIGNMELLRSTLESMHRQNVLAEPSLGDSWLARAHQYANHGENFRLALRAIDEALSSGVSRRHALEALMAFPATENLRARSAVLDSMQQIADELSDKAAQIKILAERLEHDLIDEAQLRTLFDLAQEHEEQALAQACLEHALYEVGSKDDPEKHWAIWAFVDQRLEAQECSEQDRTRIWEWLHICTQSCSEDSMRERVAALANHQWFPESPSACIKTIETLLEDAAAYEPYRKALWELYQKSGDIASLLDITERNLALLNSAQDRVEVRVRFVQATWDHVDGAEYRLDMLRDALSEDPAHAKAQALLVEHYRESGELEELEALLTSRLQSARHCQDSEAQAQIGLSLAKIHFEKDPESGLLYCKDLLEQSEVPQVEVAALCVSWLTRESGREHFARAFGYQELGSDETWGHYQNFLFERYQTLITHGDSEQTRDATLAAAGLLEKTQRVDEAITLVRQYRDAHPDCSASEASLVEIYQKHERFDALVDLLLHQANGTDDAQERFDTILRAAKLTHDELDNPSRALALLDTLEVSFASEEHYRLLQIKIDYLGDEDPERLLEHINAGLPDLDALSQFDLQDVCPDKLRDALGHVELQALKAQTLSKLGQHESALALFHILSVVDAEHYRQDWLRCHSAQLEDLVEREDTALAKAAWQTSLREYLKAEQDEQDAEESGGRLCDLGRRLATQGLRDADFLSDLSRLATRSDDQDLQLRAREWALECEDPEIAIAALSQLFEAAVDEEDYEQAQGYLDQCKDALYEKDAFSEHQKRLYHLQENYLELAKLELQTAQAQEDPEASSAGFKQAAQWFEQAQDEENLRLCLEEAAQRSPQDYALFVRLVDLDLERDDIERASTRLDQALEAIPKDRDKAPLIAQLSFKKSQLMGASEDPTAQLEWLQKAHNTNRNDVEIASALADLAESNEDWELASRVLRQLSSIGEDDGAPSQEVLCVRQARLWQRAQDLRKASFWAHKARHAAPSSDEIRALLEELAAQQRGES